jgi:hypothetical protein
MSDDVQGTATSQDPENQKSSPIKRALLATEGKFAFVKGLTFIGFLGTLIAAYFQYLTAYEDKAATQAKEDLTAATVAFTDTSTALSVPIMLQATLFRDFVNAKGGGDQNALPSKDAEAVYKAYVDANTSLRQNINLLARKMEIYLDWPSDLGRELSSQHRLGLDPISTSALGAHDFDCDDSMPSFAKGDSRIQVRAKNGDVLDVDWFSAKHHVFTIGYCFAVTHDGYLSLIRQWASRSSHKDKDIDDFFSTGKQDVVQARLNRQVVRLNDFMTLAMDEIDRIRLRYQPTGFACHVPGLSELVSAVSSLTHTRRCRPL